MRYKPLPGRPTPTEPTEQQKALVELMIVERAPLSELAPRAGYKDTRGGHRAAREALKKPWVQAYLLKRTQEELGRDYTVARLVLHELATNARSEYVRFQAAKDIMDRVEKLVGPQKASEVGLSINISLTADDHSARPTIDITPASDRRSRDTALSPPSDDTPPSPAPDTPGPTDSEDLPS